MKVVVGSDEAYRQRVYQLVYVSSQIIHFTEESLKELLEFSRRKNSACSVTGLLLYVSGNFIQLLEGNKEDVLATMARIEKDERHRGLIKLLETECEKRDFADWSMGFERIAGPEAEKLPGYSDFLSPTSDSSTQASAALQILDFFKRINRPEK